MNLLTETKILQFTETKSSYKGDFIVSFVKHTVIGFAKAYKTEVKIN